MERGLFNALWKRYGALCNIGVEQTRLSSRHGANDTLRTPTPSPRLLNFKGTCHTPAVPKTKTGQLRAQSPLDFCNAINDSPSILISIHKNYAQLSATLRVAHFWKYSWTWYSFHVHAPLRGCLTTSDIRQYFQLHRLNYPRYMLVASQQRQWYSIIF